MAIKDVLTNAAQSVDVNSIGSVAQSAGTDAVNGAIDYAANKVSQATGRDVSQYADYAKQAVGSAAQSYIDDYTSQVDQRVQQAQKEADANIAKNANLKDYTPQINAMYDAKLNQSNALIDQQTAYDQQQQVRSYQDQLPDYQNQYRTYTQQMYNGIDNAALEARANGQFGGTATAMVGAIQNYYQQARQELALKQKKLANETVQAVEKLRSQGEFDKAEQALKIGQERLSALYDEGVRLDENQRSNWEYDNDKAREDAEIQRQREQDEKNWLRQAGTTLLQNGIVPEQNVLNAMGISRAQATAYVAATKGG